MKISTQQQEQRKLPRTDINITFQVANVVTPSRSFFFSYWYLLRIKFRILNTNVWYKKIYNIFIDNTHNAAHTVSHFMKLFCIILHIFLIWLHLFRSFFFYFSSHLKQTEKNVEINFINWCKRVPLRLTATTTNETYWPALVELFRCMPIFYAKKNQQQHLALAIVHLSKPEHDSVHIFVLNFQFKDIYCSTNRKRNCHKNKFMQRIFYCNETNEWILLRLDYFWMNGIISFSFSCIFLV